MKRILLLSFLFSYIGMLSAQAQERTITGTVTSSDDGSTVPGVNVILKGTTTGTTTDLDGNYRFTVPSEGGTLVFTFIGLRTEEVEIGSRSVVDIALSSDVQELQEVVVTALGISREKKALGYGVTTLGSQNIEGRPEADLGRILRGKAPGVDIQQTSGIAGTGTNIIIRGYSSVTGTNQPLFVIDGVPFNSDTNTDQSFVAGGATASSRFLDLDPNNIKEVSILKGLSATVLYGEAGRNGVILVTTKTGGASVGNNDLNVRFSQNVSFSEVANLPDYQNTYGNGFSGDFGWFFSNWGPAFDVRGSNGIAEDGTVEHPYDQPQYNADFPEFIGQRYEYKAYESVENFFRTGVASNTSIGFDKNLGSEGVISMNYSYLDDRGFIPNDVNRFKKHNFSLGGNTTLSNGIRVNTSFNYIDSDRNAPPAAVGAGSNPSGQSLFANLIYTPRSIDLLNLPFQSPVDGSMVYYRRGAAIQNPLWTIQNALNEEDIRRFFGNIQMSYDITDWLTVTYRAGLDQYAQQNRRWANKGGSQNALGFLSTSQRYNRISDHVLNLSFRTDITSDLSFDGLIGYNARREVRDETFAVSTEQFVFNIVNHNNFTTHQNFQRLIEENTLGLYATATFGFRDYLYLNFQARNDWTSTLEKDNRSITYPSASVSFVPTDAIVSLENNILNYWKVRVGYGLSAGYPNPYQTRTALGSSTNSWLNNGVAVNRNTASNRLGNAVLEPETHAEFELGTELKFWDNRIGADLSYYNKQSRDLIIGLSLDPATGFTTTTVNGADLENKGVEFALNLNPVRNPVNVQLDLNYTRNRNNVISIIEGVDQVGIQSVDPVTGGVNANGFDGVNNFIIPGQQYGVLQGFGYTRRDGQRLVGSDGFFISEQDVSVIGNPNPNWTGNASLTLSWKGLNLYGQMSYVSGGDIYSITAATMLARGNTVDTDFERFLPVVLPGVIEDADGTLKPNDIQVYIGDGSFRSYFFANEGAVFDGTSLRLREVSLSYDLPASLLSGTPIGVATVRVFGQNLWYKAYNFPEGVNYDPEVLSTGVGNNRGLEFATGPTSRIYGGGLTLTF